MMLVFRIVLLVCLVICFIGAIGGRDKDEKSRMVTLFGCAGLLFLLTFVVEKIW